jgi:hypothetical protein
VIAANSRAIAAAEGVVAEHLQRWQQGYPTPTSRHFDELARQWDLLTDGDGLTVEWPTLRILASDEPVGGRRGR